MAIAFGTSTPVAPVTVNPPAGPPVITGSVAQTQPWQTDAWRLWKHVGELHYPTTRLARQTSQLDWRVYVNGRQLVPDTAKREMAKATAGIGQRESTYLLSLNLQVAGEGWYVETKKPGKDGEGGEFAVWSIGEPDLEKKLEAARRGGRYAKRIWQADPTDPNLADSSVRTAIGPAEEVLVLQSLSRAQARSRISQAGVIVTPAEQLYAAEDPWEKNLQEGMSRAIQDVDSPSAFVPLLVRMRRDLINSVRYITFPRPYDDLIDRKVDRAVTRIANALDIEPELIAGQGNATFWNAWAISMDTYQAHVAPRADQIGELYADVLEFLRARDGQTVAVEVEPDPRVILSRRSTARDALDGLKVGAVGYRYFREAIGAAEEDAPTAEDLEIMERLGVAKGNPDRERRVGENPGPARSSPENSLDIAADPLADVEVARHARCAVGFKLRDEWRNTPNRHRLNGLAPSDYTTVIPLEDINREMLVAEVIADAIGEMVTAPSEIMRLTSWIIDTLATPLTALTALAMEPADA
jgi:hypothetical protein